MKPRHSTDNHALLIAIKPTLLPSFNNLQQILNPAIQHRHDLGCEIQ